MEDRRRTTDRFWLNFQARYDLELERDRLGDRLDDIGVAGGYAVLLYNLLGYPAGVVPFDRVRKEEEVGRKPSRDTVEKAALKVERGSAGLPVGCRWSPGRGENIKPWLECGRSSRW